MAKKVSLKRKADLSALGAMEELDLDVNLTKNEDYERERRHSKQDRESLKERKVKSMKTKMATHLSEMDSDNEQENVVHNRTNKGNDTYTKKGKLAKRTDSRSLAVLPSDAHRRDGYDREEVIDYGEEEEMAIAAEHELRKQTNEEDFAIANVETKHKIKSADTKTENKEKNIKQMFSEPAIETVERNFALLSSQEQIDILRTESPELLKMLEEVKMYLNEVKELAEPLRKLLYERKLSESDRELVSFLETKVHLMLSYCMHVTFYLLLKVSGEKIAAHPVIDTLVEIRVYLEKMWPLEEKLQYFLNRLLSGKSVSVAHLDQLRPITEHSIGMATMHNANGRLSQNAETKERRRLLREAREAEELEHEELSAMSRVRSRRASQLSASGINANTKSLAPLSYEENEDQYFAKLAEDDYDESAHHSNEHDHDEREKIMETNLSLLERLRRRDSLKVTESTESSENRKSKLATLHDPTDVDQSSEVIVDSDVGDEEEEEEEEMDTEETLVQRHKSINIHDKDEGKIRKGAPNKYNVYSSDDNNNNDDDEHENEVDEYDALWDEEEARQVDAKEKLNDASVNRFDKEISNEVDRRKVNKKIESHRGLTKARPRDRKNPRVAQRRKYARKLQVHKSQSRQFHAEPEGGFVGVKSIKPTVVRSTKLEELEGHEGTKKINLINNNNI